MEIWHIRCKLQSLDIVLLFVVAYNLKQTKLASSKIIASHLQRLQIATLVCRWLNREKAPLKV